MLSAYYLLTWCLLLSDAVASIIQHRSSRDDSHGHPWIDHDKVVAFLQDSSDTAFAGGMERTYNPRLLVTGGCDPYPAVDAAGALG